MIYFNATNYLSLRKVLNKQKWKAKRHLRALLQLILLHFIGDSNTFSHLHSLLFIFSFGQFLRTYHNKIHGEFLSPEAMKIKFIARQNRNLIIYLSMLHILCIWKTFGSYIAVTMYYQVNVYNFSDCICDDGKGPTGEHTHTPKRKVFFSL